MGELLTVYVIAGIIFLGILWKMIRHSPIGYEDNNGFHYGIKPSSSVQFFKRAKLPNKPVDEFCDGFTQFLQDNPDVSQEFNDAWYNADNRTINDIMYNYVSELESQS